MYRLLQCPLIPFTLGIMVVRLAGWEGSSDPGLLVHIQDPSGLPAGQGDLGPLHWECIGELPGRGLIAGGSYFFRPRQFHGEVAVTHFPAPATPPIWSSRTFPAAGASFLELGQAFSAVIRIAPWLLAMACPGGVLLLLQQ